MKPNTYNYNNQSGMYRNKILIQQLQMETDSRKQQTEKFVDFGYYFAMKKTQKADETNNTDREITRIEDRFIVRYSERLNELLEIAPTSVRIVHRSLVYNVVSAINDNGLNDTITFICKAGD